VLKDESGKHSLAELRSYQDWYLKYYLKAIPGVAEVASLGGFTQQYQINVESQPPAFLRDSDFASRRCGPRRQQRTGAGTGFGGAEYCTRPRVREVARGHRRHRSFERARNPDFAFKDVGEVVLGPISGGVPRILDGTGKSSPAS